MQVLEDEGTLPVFFMNDESAVTPNANYCGFQLTRDCACSKILNKWISFYLKLFIGTNWELFNSLSSPPHSLLFPGILKSWQALNLGRRIEQILGEVLWVWFGFLNSL